MTSILAISPATHRRGVPVAKSLVHAQEKLSASSYAASVKPEHVLGYSRTSSSTMFCMTSSDLLSFPAAGNLQIRIYI
jgi:hypothetical protein